MISKKVFAADGSNIRFLSDFIIRSEQFTRVYNYIYDMNGVEGAVDVNSGLFIRVNDVPNSADLVTIEKWDLVDNSISFYTPPYAGSRVYIEVATTSEEFGDTLVQPSVERAEAAAAASEASAAAALVSEGNAAASEAQAAAEAALAAAEAAAALASQVAAAASAAAALVSEGNASASEIAAAASAVTAANEAAASAASAAAAAASAVTAATEAAASAVSANDSQLRAWEAEAEKMTADSYATEAEDVFVNSWASDGDGTFTATPTTDYSALHHSAKAAAVLVIVPVPSFPADEGLALVARAGGNDWEKILGLPLETGNEHKTVTTDGVEGDSYWSPIVTSPDVISTSFAMTAGANGSIVSPTINDGVTVTVPDGSTLVIL